MGSIHIRADVSFTDFHERGLKSIVVVGDAPAVAEIIRTATGGELPAHPESVKVDVHRLGVGPRHVAVRAYPIGEWKDQRINRKSLYEAAVRIAEAFGASVEDEDDC